MNKIHNPSFVSEAVTDKLGNTCMRVTCVDKNGMQIEKLLALDDYISLITGSVYDKGNKMVRIGTMPEHYYDGSVSTEGNSFRVILHLPAEKRALSFGGKHWFVPFPNLIFYFEVKKGTISSKYCYATPAAELSEVTPLLRYPFGNVSSSGSICYGNIALKIPDMKHIEDACDAFFMSVTNNDYYEEIAGMKQEKLLTKLKKLESYPPEWLLPLEGKMKTLGDLSKKLSN